MGWSLALSVLLHAGVMALVTGFLPSAMQAQRREHAALDVRLRDAPEITLPPAPVAPRLILPQKSQPHPSAARPPVAAQRLSGEAARSARRQIADALLYPREAIEQGIEGEATVLLFLDEAGDAIAARLEASSGHALLDDAAVRAARGLRSLPTGAPREALLPVRFRLR